MLKDPEEVSKITITTPKHLNDLVEEKHIVNCFKAKNIANDVQNHGS